MKIQILAIASAMTLSVAAIAQTAAPASTAPTPSSPGPSQSGSSMIQGQSSDRATGAMTPNAAPTATGKNKSQTPGAMEHPTVAPGAPDSSAAQPPAMPH